MQRALSTVVLLGLLLASAGAFALTEHLKLIKSPIYDTHVTKAFSPVCGCLTDEAQIGFRDREPGKVTITIVDSSSRRKVATVRSGAYASKALKTWFWNGRTSAGTVAPDGIYQPKIELASSGRTFLMPNRITLDTSAPRVLSASDGNGHVAVGKHHAVAIKYVLSAKAHVVVYLGSVIVIVGRPTRTTAGVKWNGKSGGKAVPPGRYVLTVAAVDLAGNETPPAARKSVVVTVAATATPAGKK